MYMRFVILMYEVNPSKLLQMDDLLNEEAVDRILTDLYYVCSAAVYSICGDDIFNLTSPDLNAKHVVFSFIIKTCLFRNVIILLDFKSLGI
jgi:hypothetical protein